MHINDVVTRYNHSCVHVQVLVCTCSSHCHCKYKNQYENNTQYPFYTVAVKHETGELLTLTHTLAETKVQITYEYEHEYA